MTGSTGCRCLCHKQAAGLEGSCCLHGRWHLHFRGPALFSLQVKQTAREVQLDVGLQSMVLSDVSNIPAHLICACLLNWPPLKSKCC